MCKKCKSRFDKYIYHIDELIEVGIFESELVNSHGFSFSGTYNGRYYHLTPKGVESLKTEEDFWESVG